MNKIPEKSSQPSYLRGWVLIIIAVAFDIVVRLITGAMAASARGLPMGDYLYSMNRIVMVRGIVDIIAVALVIIGIILLLITRFSSSKPK
jgi:hypothetical protein